MRKVFVVFSFLALFILPSCDLFDFNDEEGLTTEEIIEGLKTALEIGTDTSTTILSMVDGYYKGDEQFIKIPLPDEAEQVRQLITNNALAELFNLDDEFENVVKSVNRAAESAAKEAAPIFGDAIRSMTISQGWDILNGIVPEDSAQKSAGFDSTAATKFFKLKTYDALTGLYAPKINDALDEDLGLGFSAVQAWNTLTNTYNTTLNSALVQTTLNIMALTGNEVNLPDEIETDLGIFSTQKALNGLFYVVGEEEKKIRKDPFQWAIDIIQRVFGYIQDHIQ